MSASLATSLLAGLGLLVGVAHTGRGARPAGAGGEPPREEVRRHHGGLRRRPGFWLATVVALMVLDQLAFTVYVRRVHAGDPAFAARYLPAGWFDLAHWGWLDALADAVGHPGALAPSLLRVPALLELPFAVLAFLVVVRMLDPALAARLGRGRALVATCALWDAVFIVAELHLRTPWTGQDVAVRAVSGVLTVAFVSWLDLGPAGPPHAGAQGVRTAAQLLVFAASTAALGVLVLVVYDVVTLYNLGRAPSWLPTCLVAGAVLLSSRLLARRLGEGAPGPVVDVLVTGLARAVATFAPAALPVRYLLLLSAPWLLVVAGLALAALAAVPTLMDVRRRLPAQVSVAGWAAGLVTVASVAGAGLVAGAMLGALAGSHSEVPLLAGVVAGTLAAVGTARAADLLLLGGPRGRRRAAPA